MRRTHSQKKTDFNGRLRFSANVQLSINQRWIKFVGLRFLNLIYDIWMRKAVFIIRLRVTTKDETFEGMVYTKMNRGEVLSHR
jgi:hypothetical protein